MHMTIHPHDERVDSGGGKGGGLNNGDIIAIVGIFATIIVAIFSKWLLDLRKTFGGVATHEGSAAAGGPEANTTQDSSYHEPDSAPVLPRVQALNTSTTQPPHGQISQIMTNDIPADELSGSLEHPRAEPVHHSVHLEGGDIIKPEPAYTGAADRTILHRELPCQRTLRSMGKPCRGDSDGRLTSH